MSEMILDIQVELAASNNDSNNNNHSSSRSTNWRQALFQRFTCLNSFNPRNNPVTLSYYYPHFTDEEILDIRVWCSEERLGWRHKCVSYQCVGGISHL